MLETGTGLVHHSSEMIRLGNTSNFHQAVSKNRAGFDTVSQILETKMKPESKTFGTVTTLMAS